MRRSLLSLAGSLALLAPSAPAQDEHVAAELFVRQIEGRLRAAIQIQVDEDWHIYHTDTGPLDAPGLPTELELAARNVEWGAPRFPEPYKHHDAGTWSWSHHGTVVVRVEGRVTQGEPGPVRGLLEGMVCEDSGVCILFELELEDAGEGPDELFADWEALMGPAAAARDEAPSGPTEEPAGGGEEGDSELAGAAPLTRPGSTSGSPLGPEVGLLAFILLAIGGGIFALLMPCTYPMIPITISFFTKQAEARGGKVLPLSLAYGAGIVLIFILIGIVLGQTILTFATHPVTNLVIGFLFVLFALVLFGVWTLQPPRFLLNAAGKASMRGGLLGVFLMGTTLVVTSFTCTAPFVGSLLSIAAAGGADLGLGRLALGMGVFGLTMAVPFVFLSLVPGKLQSMPQSGEWMHVLKVSLGFVELAAALKFFSNAEMVWELNVLSRELFLLLWAGIFAVAAFFLFGKIHLAGERADEIGPGRMVGGLSSLLLSLYCLHGYNGHGLDTVMTAIVPPYSSRIEGGSHGGEAAPEASRDHTIVVDDYARARALAAERGAPLLVNFTGFT